MHKMLVILVPLLFSLLGFEGRAEGIANIYLERHGALLNTFDVELSEPSSELEENEQLDFVDYDRRLFIPTFSYLFPASKSSFASKHSSSQASIRAPPAKLI